ncbi:hypothetical protein TL16_g09555 [Triparma laevis f. inornata]|uniref:Uncharacterized protein n=1 Tax=Triparma laevis f. inornata TaxID=1714386 RepID=A0A9W7EN51_9STRA|nr:hypothetical protein TL16_g09555 [Triparma laevis f. inornata]
MPQHLIEGIEELGPCSRKLLFDDSGEIADMHVLLDDKELVDLGMGEGGTVGKAARKGVSKKKKKFVEVAKTRPPWVGVDVVSSCVGGDIAAVDDINKGGSGNGNSNSEVTNVNRGSINSGALREKKTVVKKKPANAEKENEKTKVGLGARSPTSVTPSKTSKSESGSWGSEKENKPNLLINVEPCGLGQHLNGFANNNKSSGRNSEGKKEKEKSKEKEKDPRPRTTTKTSQKKKEPFKPKKVDRVAAFHAVQKNRELDDKKREKLVRMRKSYST